MRGCFLLCLAAVTLLPASANVFPTISYPPPGSIVNDTVTVTFNLGYTAATVPADVNDTRFLVNAMIIDVSTPTAPIGSVPVVGPTNNSHSWNTRTLPDGVWYPNISIRDLATNYEADSLPPGVRVDNTPPDILSVTIKNRFGSSAGVVRLGDTILVEVALSAEGAPIDTEGIDVVVFNDTFALGDTGSAGDRFGGDTVFTTIITVRDSPSATYALRVIARDTSVLFSVQNQSVRFENIFVDNETAAIRTLSTTDPDTIYRNGQTIIIKAFVDTDLVPAGETGLAVTADFSLIDANYITGSEIVSDDGQGTYTIRYTISLTNTFANRNDSAVTIRAADSAGNFDTDVWLVSLDNGGPTIDTIILSDLRIGTDSATEKTINDDDTFVTVARDTDNRIRSIEFFVDAIGPDSSGTVIPRLGGGSFTALIETGVGALGIGALSEGQHLIYVHAEDTTGNWGTYRSETFLIDRVGPAISNISVAYPNGASSARSGDTVTVTALIADATTRIDTAWIDATNLNGQAGIRMLDDGTNGDLVSNDNVYTVRVALTGSRTGAVTCTVAVNDVVRNQASRAFTVLRDDSAPIILILSSTDLDTIYRNGQTIIIRAFVDTDLVPAGETGLAVTADFSLIDANYITGSEIVSDDGQGTYTIRYTVTLTNTFSNRNDTRVIIRAADSAGNSDTDVWLVSLDNTGPTIDTIILSDLRIGTDSATEKTINDDDTFVTMARDTDNRIRSIEFFVDAIGPDSSGTMIPRFGGGSFTALTETGVGTLGVGSLGEGLHTIYVHAEDTTGNWGAYRSETFLIDRIGPAISNISVAYPNGASSARSGDTVTVTALITDATTRIDTAWIDATNLNGQAGIRMFDDGTNGDLVSNDNVYTARLALTGSATGAAACTVAANDIVRNQDSRSFNVLRDDSAPMILILSSTDLDTIYRNGQTIIIKAFVDTDLVPAGETGLAVTADFSLIDASYITGSEIVSDDGQGTYTIRYTISLTNTLSNRNDTRVIIRAADSAGNSDTEVWLVSLDNTGPTIDTVILSDLRIGTDSATEKTINDDDTFITVARDTDNRIRSIEFFVDAIGPDSTGIKIPRSAGGNFTALIETGLGTLSISTLSRGQHIIYVHAEDTTGNWGAYRSETFLIDRDSPLIQNVTVSFLGNTAVSDGDTILITATVFDLITDVSEVRLDARYLSGDSRVLMRDDGTNGDAIPNDDVYSARVVLTTGTFIGDTSFVIRASDVVVNSGTVTGTTTIGFGVALPVIAYVISNDPDTIYRDGQTVRLTAFVTTGGVGTAGLTIAADFFAIDTTWIRGSEVVSDDLGGTYTIRFTISANNAIADNDSLGIVVTARNIVGNTDTEIFRVGLDNSAPLFLLISTDKERYFRGETVTVTVALNDSSVSVTADFSALDSRYSPGEELPVTNLGNGSYVMSYKIDTANTIPNGEHSIKVTATDSSGNARTAFTSVQLLASYTTSDPVFFPNPFQPFDGDPMNGTATSGITIDQISQRSRVSIYNLRGGLVARFDVTPPKATWNANSSSGSMVPSGIYYYVIEGLERGGTFRGRIAVVR